jgi:hypothetical protein
VKRHVYGADDGATDRDLLLVLGWGNQPGHEPVDWLVDRLAAEWTVHAVVVPENGTDFERDYRDPLVRIYEDLDPDASAAHSLGGLTLAHVPGEEPRVYSSPFWGTNQTGLAGAIQPLLARLPIARRIVPVGSDPEAVGDLKPDDETGAGDRGLSPAWLAAVREAQASLPPFREGSVVYCSLRDEVVGVRAIGRHAPAERVRLYDGGHEFFASSGREELIDQFEADLTAIADGRIPE